MDKDSVEKLSGRAKEAAGDLTGNDKLKREGQVDQVAAKVRQKTDDVVDGVKDKLTDKRKKD